MRGIDISNWEEFRIGDIFETVNKGKQVPTGASIAKAELKENGAIPRISVSGVNNGIVGLYDYTGVSNHNYRVYNNFVSVSFLGTVFYHGGSASLDMKVHCLKPKNIVLNNYTGHFLVTAIKTSLRQSSYSDQISSSVLPNLHILLPSTTSHQPDWEFMENYMVSIEKKVKENFVLLTHVSSCKKNVIDTTNWRRFHLYDDDLFTIDSGTKLDKVKMSNKNPSVNFVGRANANNGVTDYVDEIEGVKPFEAGCLTISLGGEYLGSCFIQNKPFYTSQNVNVLIPKHPMSYHCKQFISTMIFREGRLRYKAFIDELNRHMKTDFSILLPVTDDNKPDWAFMDSFMEKMEVSAKSALKFLT